MLEKIETEIYRKLSELFACAALDEMSGDIRAYRDKLKVVAVVAEALGINTEIDSVSINIRNIATPDAGDGQDK